MKHVYETLMPDIKILNEFFRVEIAILNLEEFVVKIGFLSKCKNGVSVLVLAGSYRTTKVG